MVLKYTNSKPYIQDVSVNNMKKTGLYGYVYDIWVDHDSTDVDDMLDITTYLMKNQWFKMFGFT